MELSPHRIRVADTLEEKQKAALQVIDWGYPRLIDKLEVELSFWIHYGPTAIYWYQWLDFDDEPRRLVLHICTDPEKRGSIFARRWLYSVGIIGEILNARELFIEKSVGEEPVFDYLERMGWKPCEGGLVYPLNEFGESDDGEQTRAEEVQDGPHGDSSGIGSGSREATGT